MSGARPAQTAGLGRHEGSLTLDDRSCRGPTSSSSRQRVLLEQERGNHARVQVLGVSPFEYRGRHIIPFMKETRREPNRRARLSATSGEVSRHAWPTRFLRRPKTSGKERHCHTFRKSGQNGEMAKQSIDNRWLRFFSVFWESCCVWL